LQKAATSLEAVAITGTRGEERTVISAAVPIDVLSTTDIQLTGRTETSQIIQAVAPSFNFPRTSVGDGTDHIRPATLRGLAPDQALVLVNGKRRHTSALVNVNGFVGRGSQAVDLNAIPASMIDHIEILRDGAAAQYGSDAIAGVLNIVLKTTAPGTFMGEVGENVTTYNRDADVADRRSRRSLPSGPVRDGRVATSALNYGWAIGQSGFLQVSGEIRDRQGTNRTLPTRARSTLRRSAKFARAADKSLAGVIRTITTRADSSTLGPRFGTELKRTHSAELEIAAVRPPDLATREIDAAPLGAHSTLTDFLPFIKSKINDGSISGGLRGDASGWKWDLGTVYETIPSTSRSDNTANVSLGPTVEDIVLRRPARVPSIDDDARSLPRSLEPMVLGRFDSRRWRVPSRTSMRSLPARADSYRNGGVKVLDANGNPTTRLAAVGSQVFPGFQPTDAGSHSRTNSAGYIDLETDLTNQLLVGAAGRFEHYSDFGSTSTGKLSARFEPVRKFALRGAVSTGFRAPSLGQNFSRRRRRTSSPASRSTFAHSQSQRPRRSCSGASDLEPERSTNYSAGVAIEPVGSLALTVDFYRINIKNRIVLSDNFTGTTIQTLFASTGSTAGGGRFFTNAIDNSFEWRGCRGELRL
jgi:iron complex outermembrane receptor protein